MEAAWLHDAVWVYARALAAALSRGESPRDGRAIAAYMKNTTYRSIMGYINLVTSFLSLQMFLHFSILTQ